MKDVKNNNYTRWGEHPVVSTVLWLLGHDMNKQRASEEESRANNILSWKDDHGGHIAEYFLEVQDKTPATSSNATTLAAGTELNLDPRNSKVPAKQDAAVAEIRRLGRGNPNGLPGDESPYSPSPQWGQYIAITPPVEQEMYSKGKVQQIGKDQQPINNK